MAMLDSVDKIITRYFAIVTKENFTYKNKNYSPKTLIISPLLFRGYTCPPNCGGCCPRFSLDYLPSEKRPKEVTKRIIEFNEKEILIFSDLQLSNNDYHCKYVDKSNGRCKIHTHNPFSCDFELIRPLIFEKRANILTQKLFGRGWQLKKVNGERYALCTMTGITEQSINDSISKITRLKKWCDYFGIKSKCDEILQWSVEVRPFLLKNYSIKSIKL
jgi:Fe-S-cluster containining protein